MFNNEGSNFFHFVKQIIEIKKNKQTAQACLFFLYEKKVLFLLIQNILFRLWYAEYTKLDVCIIKMQKQKKI